MTDEGLDVYPPDVRRGLASPRQCVKRPRGEDRHPANGDLKKALSRKVKESRGKVVKHYGGRKRKT